MQKVWIKHHYVFEKANNNLSKILKCLVTTNKMIDEA